MEKSLRSFEGHKKGINLGGWLSQCNHTTERYENFIRQEDFAVIKAWGCDHVRLPIDYKVFADEEMNFKPEGFKYIERAIAWAREAGLKLVLDLHQTYGFAFHTYDKDDNFFTNRTYQDFFVKTWDELARRFAAEEDVVSFELMNEVTEQRFSQTWNSIAAEAIAAIRKYSKTIKIVVGSYWHNSAVALKDLEVPKDDKNIVLNFHCYSPILFTHQGAGWVPQLIDLKDFDYVRTYRDYDMENVRRYPENTGAFSMMDDLNDIIGPEYFRRQFKEAIEAAEKYDLPLYCGEYGVIDTADPEETVRWFADIHTVFEELGIGRAVWSYREMNFGMEGKHYEPVRERLLKLL